MHLIFEVEIMPGIETMNFLNAISLSSAASKIMFIIETL